MLAAGFCVATHATRGRVKMGSIGLDGYYSEHWTFPGCLSIAREFTAVKTHNHQQFRCLFAHAKRMNPCANGGAGRVVSVSRQFPFPCTNGFNSLLCQTTMLWFECCPRMFGVAGCVTVSFPSRSADVTCRWLVANFHTLLIIVLAASEFLYCLPIVASIVHDAVQSNVFS